MRGDPVRGVLHQPEVARPEIEALVADSVVSRGGQDR